MTKYHLDKNGKIAVCTATKRTCHRRVNAPVSSQGNIQPSVNKQNKRPKLNNVSNLSQATPIVEQVKIQNLSQDQVFALEDYSGMDYFEVNKSLRTGDMSGLHPRLQRMVQDIDAAFAQIQPEKPYTTYRGETVKLDACKNAYETIMNKFFPGSTIESKSFYSTSLNPSVAAHFAKKNKFDEVSVVIQVEAKNGISLQGLDDAPLEDEMLLPRNSLFTVKRVTSSITYQDIDFSEESAYLKEKSTSTRLFTVMLEEQ